MAGETGKNGELAVSNMKAGESHAIRIENDGKVLDSKIIRVEEGNTYTADFSSIAKTAPVEVKKDNTRRLFVSVHALQGGYGGTLGLDYYFIGGLRASLLGGAVYMNSVILPVANAGIGLDIIGFGDFKLTVYGGMFVYFTSSPTFSPIAEVEFSWLNFFIEGGARYSLYDHNIYPMCGIGIRF